MMVSQSKDIPGARQARPKSGSGPGRPLREAGFAAQAQAQALAVAVARDLDLPPERTNPNGAGVSIGHPVGATGAVLAVKSSYELARTGVRHALAMMCIGGGQGIAAIIERT
jgi:acetyl-CoA C-acetyltransferase